MPPGTWADASPDTAFSEDRGSKKEPRERSGGRTVDGDAEEVAHLLDFGPCQLERPQVPQHEVVVRPAGLQLVPVLDELVCERLRVLDHLLRVRFPGRLARLQ
jgi:hypothetical protein